MLCSNEEPGAGIKGRRIQNLTAVGVQMGIQTAGRLGIRRPCFWPTRGLRAGPASVTLVVTLPFSCEALIKRGFSAVSSGSRHLGKAIYDDSDLPRDDPAHGPQNRLIRDS